MSFQQSSIKSINIIYSKRNHVTCLNLTKSFSFLSSSIVNSTNVSHKTSRQIAHQFQNVAFKSQLQEKHSPQNTNAKRLLIEHDASVKAVSDLVCVKPNPYISSSISLRNNSSLKGRTATNSIYTHINRHSSVFPLCSRPVTSHTSSAGVVSDFATADPACVTVDPVHQHARYPTATPPTGMLTYTQLAYLAETGEVEHVVLAFTDIYGRLLGKTLDIGYYLKHGCAGTHACSYLLSCDIHMNPRDNFKFGNWESGYGDMHLVPDTTTLRRAAWREKTAIVMCDVVKDHDTGNEVDGEKSGAKKTNNQQQQQQPVQSAQPTTSMRKRFDNFKHNYSQDGKMLFNLAPRTLLQQQLNRVRAVLGMNVSVATEMEYFMFKESYAEALDKLYTGLSPLSPHSQDYHLQLVDQMHTNKFSLALNRSGVPVEGGKGEAGRGQHELNIRYAYALEMADRHQVYKMCLREMAELAGSSLTFMSKPDHNDVGSGCHVHINLEIPATDTKDKTEVVKSLNAFSPSNQHRVDEILKQKNIQLPQLDKYTNMYSNIHNPNNVSLSEYKQLSPLLLSFVAGISAHMHHIMPFYAPNINSYKRYHSKSWAPTTNSWSLDNRTCGIRIVGHHHSQRIEVRVAGSDANAYLLLCGIISSGLDGVMKGMVPSQPLLGNAYNKDTMRLHQKQDSHTQSTSQPAPMFPMSLRQATQLFKDSRFTTDTYGEDVVSHYSHFWNLECDEFDKAVTDWERLRYFKQI